MLETRRFTTDDDIAGAVVYGLDYSPHDGEKRGYLSVIAARTIMAATGAGEPKDRHAILSGMAAPCACTQERGLVRWPVNVAHRIDAATRAWGRILGIEAGWFIHDRAGFLQWTQSGRERFAAGDRAIFIETNGQSAFVF